MLLGEAKPRFAQNAQKSADFCTFWERACNMPENGYNKSVTPTLSFRFGFCVKGFGRNCLQRLYPGGIRPFFIF
jgi:hypothetical protein